MAEPGAALELGGGRRGRVREEREHAQAVGRDGVILRYAGKNAGELRTILGNK